MKRHWTDRRGWEDGVLVCKQVYDITADVKTFVLEPLEPRAFCHDPGQYLSLTLPVDGQEIDRCYTISSPPSRPYIATITVKRVPGGVASNWLHDHLVPGTRLHGRGPLGSFSLVEHPADKYLFLSGGSGITPLMSMTRTLHDLGQPTDVVFVHSARTPDDIVFRQELDLIQAASPGIRVVHVCEQDSPSESWPGHRGRMNLDVLKDIAPDFLDREVFICGPGGYMNAVRSMLDDAGFPMDHFHQESFTFDLPAESVIDTDGDEMFSVEFSRSGWTIPCSPETTILEAASRSGITLPSSCGQGLCGTCKTTLVKGSVDMNHNGGIRPREIAADKILLCCSTPQENVVVDC